MNELNVTDTGSIEDISSKSYFSNQAYHTDDLKIEGQCYLNKQLLERKLKYWQAKLANYEITSLPLDKPRLEQARFERNLCYIELGMDISNRLGKLALQLNVSLDAILLSGYYLLLRSYTNQDDIIVSTPPINQSISDNSADNLSDLFLHPLVLRAVINSDTKLVEFIIQIHNDINEVQINGDIPYRLFAQRLNIDLDASYSPFSRIIFAVQDFMTGNTGYALEANNRYGISPLICTSFMSLCI